MANSLSTVFGAVIFFFAGAYRFAGMAFWRMDHPAVR